MHKKIIKIISTVLICFILMPYTKSEAGISTVSVGTSVTGDTIVYRDATFSTGIGNPYNLPDYELDWGMIKIYDTFSNLNTSAPTASQINHPSSGRYDRYGVFHPVTTDILNSDNPNNRGWALDPNGNGSWWADSWLLNYSMFHSSGDYILGNYGNTNSFNPNSIETNISSLFVSIELGLNELVFP